MKLKPLLMSIAEYVLYFALYMYFVIPIHEWIHLQLLKLFGGDGYIAMTWYGGGVVFTKQPTHPTIVALSGGIGIAILYGIIAYWNYISMDWEELASLLPNIGSQLFYGIFEGTYIYVMPFQEFLKWGTLIQMIGWSIGLIASFYILIRWWIDTEMI